MRLALALALSAALTGADAADVAARAKAAELLEAMGTGELMTRSMAAGFAQGVQPFLDQAPAEQRAMLEQAVAAAQAHLTAEVTWASMRDAYADLYAATYSPAELDELTAFYRSPLGQRVVVATPGLTVESMALSNRRVQALMPELQRIIGETIERAQSADKAKRWEAVGLAIGKPFPAMTLATTDGGTISTTALAGKVVLIDYWATWCQPCVRELPTVIAAHQRFHDQGFEVVGISLDEDLGKLERFVADKKVPWKQHCDGQGWQSEAARRFGIDSIPATFLIGRDGTLIGTDLRGEALAEAVAAALGQSAP